MNVELLHASGRVTVLDAARWHQPASDAEVAMLTAVEAPVVDLGCGPGRIVGALAELGIPALGVDASPAAVRTASETGAPVLCRSVFERLPGEGRWRTAVLLDGNVGIGGDPVALLRRTHRLLMERGEALVEVEPGPVETVAELVRLDVDGQPGSWFLWARVAVDDLPEIAASAGFDVVAWLRPDGRHVARLRAVS